MSTGFVLNIPQEMLNRLEDADKKIEKLARTSEEAQTRIVSAFKNINTHGIDAFINKLTEAQTKLSQLGSTQINTNANAGAFANLTSQAQNVIDEVNRIVTAMGRVKKATGDTGMTKNPFAGMTESLKQWNNLQSQIDATDAKIKKLTSTTMDYERQMQRMRSGQTTPMNISYNEYAYTKERIAALQEEKRVLQEKQAEITRQNNALSEQVRIQESLKRFIANQDSLPEQRKRREYEAMRQMYIEDEKASEAAERKKVKDAENAEKERQKLREKRIREEEKAAERERKAYERMYKQLPATINTKQAGQLVARSMDATSINQRLVAIKNLQTAINNLDSTDKRYDQTVRRLNSEINRQKDELKRLGVESDKVRASHRSLMDISGQLARKLALVFSVSQITGYVKKLIEVRGEFELQQRSLQAILQNKDEANRIWQQTVDLAVRSPFRVKELVSYTKQLAAYRIESDKLFETNKMLADISAGLGVDMQRLILAFGQVRSAAYLRGTELRQFTEAGIPILEQLAKYFTELEGRAVSVGDVFERVSKRMVSFADVEEIFKRMTSEGGTFFRMQEIQAETLRGQISNLKDSVDLMLNDIGKAHEGTLKNSVKFVRSLVENWEALATAIKAVVAVLAMTKLNALLAKEAVMLLAIDMGILTNAAQTQLTITQLLRVGYMSLIKAIKGVGAAMKSLWVNNPWVLAITAVVVAVWKLVAANKAHKEAIEEVNKAFEENRNRMKKISVDFTYASGKGDLDTAKKKLSELIALANDEYSMNIEVNLKELSEEELKEYFVNLRQKMNEANSFAQTFVTEMQKFTEWTFTADITESASHLSSGATQYMNYLETASKKAIYALQEQEREAGKLSSSMQEALNNLVPPQGVQEDALTYLERLEKGLTILSNEAFKLYNKAYKADTRKDKKYWEDRYEEFNETYLTPTMVGFGKLTEQSEFTFWSLELKHQYKDFLDNLYVPSNMSDEDKRIYFTVAIDKAESQWGWNEFVRDYIERWTEERFEFEFVPKPVDPKKLDPWAERVKEAISEVNNKIKSESESVSDADLFPLPKVGQTKEAYLALAKEVIGIAKRTYNETQQIEDESTVNRTKALAPYVAEVEKILNLYKNSKKDILAERLKNQIALIKEMNKEYEKLNKTFSASESIEKIKNAYADTAKDLGFDLSKMDFTDAGTIKSLEDLLGDPQYAANKYALELKKALDDLKVELGIETKQGEDEKLKNKIQEFFDQYDLSLELKKLNIPPELAKSLFDVDYLDLEDLKKAVEDQKDAFMGKDMLDEYDDLMKKIGELSRKRQEEEAKEFINFLKKNLDEVKLIQDKGAYNIALADRLFGEGKITAEQYMSSIRQIVEDTNKEVAKVNLDKFKDSATYIKAMGNLAAYSRDELEGMISALQGQVGANAGNMGADEIRAYYEALERLVDQYDKIESPFQKGEINDLIEYLGLQKQLNQEKEKEAALEQRKAELNTRLMLLQNKLASQQASGDNEGAKFTQGLIKSAVNELKEVDGELVSVTSNISVISEKVANLGDGMVKSLVIAQKVVNEIANIANASTKMFDDIKSAADALGADTESGGWAKAGYAMEMVGGVSSELTSGLSNLASGNFAGALANVVGMVTKLISGFAKIHDQDYQDIIEAQAEAVERLGKAYEKLETSTESAYSIQQLQQYNEELERNVELQIASYKAMIAAENAKKNTDTEQIEAWNEELKALTQQWEELKQSLVEGVGGVTDYRSQTREFVDSWVSAFKETGDGLSGLKENFREFFDNIIAEQAALRVTEKFLAPFYESLNTALGDLELTTQESKNLRAEADRIMPELSKALELIWAELGGSRGDSSGGSLSALQKGIQGITESTAQVLEAIANSSRGYLASIDSKMNLVLANLGAGVEENPMLEQMRLVAKNTSAINTLLGSLVKGGHPQGGQGLKVFMN